MNGKEKLVQRACDYVHCAAFAAIVVIIVIVGVVDKMYGPTADDVCDFIPLLLGLPPTIVVCFLAFKMVELIQKISKDENDGAWASCGYRELHNEIDKLYTHAR
jgi:hypothetical protein